MAAVVPTKLDQSLFDVQYQLLSGQAQEVERKAQFFRVMAVASGIFSAIVGLACATFAFNAMPYTCGLSIIVFIPTCLGFALAYDCYRIYNIFSIITERAKNQQDLVSGIFATVSDLAHTPLAGRPQWMQKVHQELDSTLLLRHFINR